MRYEKTSKLSIALLIGMFIYSCSNVRSVSSSERWFSQFHTSIARNKTIKKLNRTAIKRQPYLGHQDDLLRGQNWLLSDKDYLYRKSDIFSVSGVYPYVYGFDIGRIEYDSKKNIDGASFEQMKCSAISHYQRGGFITISWHMNNPVTDSTSWDKTAGDVVHRILHNPVLKQKYLSWLDKGADFINQIVDDKGNRIPILFRPLHECNINAFWWGENYCTEADYISLWRLTFDYLVNTKKMHQLIWVFSPYDVKTKEELLSRYPGDRYVDILGYEQYQFGAVTYEKGAEQFVEKVRKGIDCTVELAKERNKIVAFTETGFTGVPYDKWWTEAIGKAIDGKELSYLYIWYNGYSESYYFGPCPKSKSSDNFNELLKSTEIRTLNYLRE